MLSNIYKGSGFGVKVLKIIEGIINVSYSPEAKLNAEVYNLESEIIGFVFSICNFSIEIIMLKDIRISLFDIVYIGTKPISFKFNNNVLGSVVTSLGELTYHFTLKENFQHQNEIPIFANAPNINQRSEVKEQLLTGHNVIDFLFPIGYGQRMMIIGDTKLYKTTETIKIIKTIMLNRKAIDRDKKTIFIYTSIGQKLSHIKEVMDYLIKNVIGNTLIINSQCNDTLGMQFLAPYSAMAMADYYSKQGYNIVVLLDDLSKHAICYRELMLLAKKSYGRDYYASDIFYKHSSLLERAYNNPKGGSVTSFVLTETIDEELTSYINTNIISITDGQLVFAKELLKFDITPAISTKYSVSRIGFNAQSKILNKVATFCSISLSNYYNNLDFYNMYRNNCDDKIKSYIYTGLYVINMIYKLYPNTTIDYVKQIIIATMIHIRYLYNEFTLSNIEDNLFILKVKKDINAVYDIIMQDSDIVAKMKKDINDLEIMQSIEDVLKQLLKNKN
jgi:F-type H+-transporting ATPase subunit alpha